MATASVVLKVTTTERVTIRGPKAQAIADFLADKIVETQSTYGDSLAAVYDLGDTETSIAAEVEK